MADVKIIDIDSEQWNMKDEYARQKIAELGQMELLTIGGSLPNYTLPNNIKDYRFLVLRFAAGSSTRDVLFPISNINITYLNNFIGWEGSGLVSRDNCLYYISNAQWTIDYNNKTIKINAETHNNVYFVQGINKAWGIK